MWQVWGEDGVAKYGWCRVNMVWQSVLVWGKHGVVMCVGVW